MKKISRKITTILTIFILLFSMITPFSVQANDHEGLSVTVDLTNLAQYEDLNAEFEYQDVSDWTMKDIQTKHVFTSMNESLDAFAYLNSYNEEKYEFLGWSINGQEPTNHSASQKDIGIDEEIWGYFIGATACETYFFEKTCLSGIAITMEDTGTLDVTFQPVFALKDTDITEYSLTIEEVENGTVTSTKAVKNKYVLEASPRGYAHFVGWKKNEETEFFSTDLKTEIVIEEDTTIIPVFEKNTVKLTLTEDPYVFTKTNLVDFNLHTSLSKNVTPLFEGQRVNLYFPYQTQGTGFTQVPLNIKVYEGTNTSGQLLNEYNDTGVEISPYDHIKYASITVDPLPSSGAVTIEMTVNGEAPLIKTYKTEVQPAEEKDLVYLTTPSAPYDISTEDTGPDILDVLSFVDEETGHLDVYAAAFGGVLKLTGTNFEFIKGLEFTSAIDSSMGRVLALGGTKEKLTAVAINHTETTEYVTIYEYTVATNTWKELENAYLDPQNVSKTYNALVIDSDNIWTDYHHWDGTKWTKHDYKFSRFVNSRNGHYFASTSDGKAYEYRTKSKSWQEIQLGGSPKISNITQDGTIAFSSDNGISTRDVSGNIVPAPLSNQVNLDKSWSSHFYNIDRKGNSYLFENSHWYGQVRTTGAEGHSIYKFDAKENKWKYQDIPAFYAPNEYAVGTSDYLNKKVRPTAVKTIYNLSDKASIYAGRGGAVYADFDETTITFNSNGGSEVAPLTAKINSQQNAPTPTKADEHFAGWYLDKELTKAYSLDYMPAKNLELFAKWVDKPVDLTQVKATANQTIEEAYKMYNKRDYDEEGWASLTKAKTEGLAAIAAMSSSEDEVKAATNKVLAAMKDIKVNQNITVAVSMEKFTLGQGYIIEPTLVTVPRNTQASKVITDLLVKKYGAEPLPYKMTGNVTTNFYLAHVLDDGYKSDYKIPAYIMKAIEEDGSDFSLDNDEWLGEFDFFKNSGWMYAVNNVFPGVGAAGWTLENDQVMRWQYTIYGLGADLNANNEEFGGSSIVKTAQKDDLTWRVAEINSLSAEEKKAFLATGDNQKQYDEAYKVLTNMESTQAEVDSVLKALGGTDRVGTVVEVTMPTEAKVVNDAIKALPSNIKLSDKEAVEKIRKQYEGLDSTFKQWIWKDEIAILEAAEKKIATLEADAKKVSDQIAKLPAVANIELTDEQSLKDAQAAYASLSKEQQALVTNAALLTDLTTKLAELKKLAKDPVKEVEDLITLLPNKYMLKISDESQLTKAYNAYQALTAAQKLQVTNIATLNDLFATLAQLKQVENTKAAESVITLITALPDEASLKVTHEASIKSVESAYNALTTEQKLLVTNRTKLTTLVAKLTQLKSQQSDAEVAAKVTTLINNLPAESALTYANKINVEYVRTQYQALTTAQKALVMNVSKLVEAEEKLTSFETDIQLVINEIKSLPKAENLTSQHQTIVATIRAAYAKLATAQKAAVTNYSTLIEAEIKLVSLGVSTDTGEKNDTEVTVPEEYKEAVEDSKGIQSITEKKNQLTIEAKDNADSLLVTISNELLKQIRENKLSQVEIKTAEDVSIIVPSNVFTDVGSKSSLQIETIKSKQGLNQVLQINIYEVLSNGIERSLVLPNSYLQVTLSLSDFTNSTVASLNTVAANKNNGVIVRLVDGEYKAVPHTINGDEVIIYTNSNGKFVYLNETRTFKDVKATNSFKEDIEFLASRYVVNGTTETTYSPSKSITRAQFGAMIARSLNLVPTESTVYSDIKGKWYEDDIQALYEAGITNAPGQFRPNDLLTREQAAAFMFRVLEYIQKDELSTTNRLTFKDSDQIASQFVEAVATLNSLSIMEGNGKGEFNPKGHLTRAQMAKILRRTLEEINMM